MKKSFIISSLLIIILLCGCSNYFNKESLPKNIGDLELIESIKGEKAQESLDRLHNGLSLKPDESEIGYYGGDPPKAVIWIAYTKDKSKAKELLSKMTKDTLKKSGYSNINYNNEKGIGIVSAQGYNQEHYYFIKDKKVIWLAVDEEYSKGTLSDLIEHVGGK